MADGLGNDSFENESVGEISPKAVLSTSFTISFEEEDQSVSKQKKIMKTTNMFARRHVRTLSLPIGSSCVPKQQPDRKSAGEGQERNLVFNDQSANQRTDKRKDVKHTKKYSPVESDHLESTESEDCLKSNRNCEEEIVSDSESEGGTYTLDKDNKEILVARKTIDQVFGISPAEELSPSNAKKTSDKENRSRMVDEWIEQSVTAIKTSSKLPKTVRVTTNSCFKDKTYVSKIPSPVFGRRELNFKGANITILNKPTTRATSTESGARNGTIERRTLEHLVNSPTNGDIDTTSYLKETENIVAALHNRLQTDLKQCNKLEKEPPANKYSNTRFNRAFSLRRDRLKKPAVSVVNNTAIPIRAKNSSLNSRINNKINGYTPAVTEKKINSPKLTRPSSASIPKSREQMRLEDLKKKPLQKPKASGGLRCNSSLSAQEIEFQNWKRRKSYDPLKAAAEDRKKKSMMQSAGGSASVSTVTLTKKQKATDHNENDETSEKGIMRSASFHGLRNKNGYDRLTFFGTDNIDRSASSFILSSSLSNENSNSSEDLNNVDKDDWVIPKPPSTSLQNTPPESMSSRLSLLSHAMSNSSVILSSSSNTKVNFMTLLNVTQLTCEIRNAVTSLTDSLKDSIDNSSEHSRFQKQNGYSFESKTECSENFDNDNEENTYPDNDLDLDEDYIADTGDDSRSNDLSGNDQLNMALHNLIQVQDAVQKLQLFCANK